MARAGLPAIRAEAAQVKIYFGDEVASTGVHHAVNIISAIAPKVPRSPPSRASNSQDLWMKIF